MELQYEDLIEIDKEYYCDEVIDVSRIIMVRGLI